MTTLPTGYHFHSLALDADLPEAWRALDRAVARWVSIHGGSPLLAHVAGWASLAEGHGDSALPLSGTDRARHGMAALDDDALASMHAEPMVEVIGANDVVTGDAPFIIDRAHFYLRRNFRHELAVAQQLDTRRAAGGDGAPVSTADLDLLFDGVDDSMVHAQRVAVASVPGHRLFVLTGGPGTGKTTTVLRMLLVLIAQRAARGEAAPVIRISAPTGKAAQRLSASLREGAKGLRERPGAPLPADWQANLEVALAADASTLHRLLGSRGRGGGFRHHAGDSLPADIVVVDEASMVDLALLRALLDALREDAVLILVGDADQLTSVGTGSVLLDVVSALEADAAPYLVRLQHSFRADQALVPINRAILGGDPQAFAAAWHAAGPSAIRRELVSVQDLRRHLAPWCRALLQLLRASGANDVVPDERPDLVLAALDALRARQLLCALREGEFGATAVNALIDASVRPASDRDATWYPGRAVMITRNDAAAGLFNGDVGLCLRHADGQLRVWFEVTVARVAAGAAADASAASTRSVRAFAPGNLPEHQGAFAVTIHKSQGSEYGHVALLLPPDADNRILSRQLLYTGASRAKHVIEIWATDAALSTAIATPVLRAGGLRQRLQRATAGARS